MSVTDSRERRIGTSWQVGNVADCEGPYGFPGRSASYERPAMEGSMRRLRFFAGSLLSITVVACAVQQKPPAADGKAVVDAYVRAWNQHDSAAFDTLMAPGAIHEDPAQNFRGTGAKEITKFMRDVISVEPDFKWTVSNSIEDGKFVALEWTWTSTYTGPDPSGKQVTNRHLAGRGASLAEVENGKIKRFTDFYDQASFFR
jgi:steroid delta-isomerase-like uncharacterized protein